jgi:Flp pilus assembly protein TadG
MTYVSPRSGKFRLCGEKLLPVKETRAGRLFAPGGKIMRRSAMRRRLIARSLQRSGAALVEMAIVLPIFLMVSFGIIEFGRALMVANLVTNSAREGARLAVLDGSSNTQVEQAVKNFLTASLNLSPNDVTVTITITPATGNPDPANQCSAAQARDLIAVNVQVPFSKVALIPGGYLTGANLVGRSAMRHE